MFCSQCGNSLPDTAKFCSKCGTPVNGDANAPKIQAGYPEVKTPENAIGDKDLKKWLALAAGAVGIIVVIAAVLLISNRSNSNKNPHSDTYMVQQDTFEDPSPSEPSLTDKVEDNFTETDSEETESATYSYREIALTGDERESALYDRESSTEISFERANSSVGSLSYGWYDKDGFYGYVIDVLREEEIALWPIAYIDSRSAEHVFFFDPYRYSNDYYSVKIGLPHPDRWDYSGVLADSIDYASIYFKQGEENTIELHPTENSQEYLTILYSFDPATNELIFTLNNTDFRFEPFIGSSLYNEALSNYANYCFASADYAKWSANADFKTYIENAIDCTLNHSSSFSYSCTLISSDSGLHSGTCRLNSSESNMATMVFFHWKQLDRNSVQFYEPGSSSVYATFEISDDSLTLNIDGYTYSFRKLD